MTTTVSITESNLLAALRAWLLSIIDGATVVKGQDNRVAMPQGSFLVMTSLGTSDLNVVAEYWVPGTSNPGTTSSKQARSWRCQVDCYGPAAMEATTIIAALVKSSQAFDAFATQSVDMALLDCEPAKQTNMLNAENQFENRWTIELSAQYNPVVTTSQDFAASLVANLVEIDTTYPPGP